MFKNDVHLLDLGFSSLWLVVFLFCARTIDIQIAPPQEVIEERGVLLVLHEALHKLVLAAVELLGFHAISHRVRGDGGRWCSNAPRAIEEAAMDHFC